MSIETYKKWKAGERVFKAPWVKRYYENITDLNQFKFSKVVEDRVALIIGTLTFILGLVFGFLVFG